MYTKILDIVVHLNTCVVCVVLLPMNKQIPLGFIQHGLCFTTVGPSERFIVENLTRFCCLLFRRRFLRTEPT